MTDTDFRRIGDMLRGTTGARIANPYRLWKLDPPRAPGPSAAQPLDRESV